MVLFDVVLTIHSVTRWVIAVVGVLAVIKFAVSWLGQRAFTSLDRGLSSGFSGLMDLQVLTGLIFLLWTGVTGAGFPMLRIEHAVTMFIAAVVAHLPMVWRKAEDKIRFRNSLVAVLVSLALVYLGVARLPGGWSR
jgi:hypothetical protein